MQFEIQITLFLQHLGTWLVGPFTIITSLGEEFFYLIAMPAIYWCFDATIGFRLGAMLVFTNSINGYFKALFHSPRPFWVDSRVKAYVSEVSFGLPSGHSQNAASLWGTLAVSIKKTWVTLLSLVVIFLIGLSRIYLGVHFTRDVLAGWLIGAALVILYFWLEKRVARWISQKSLTFKVIAAFLVSVLIIAIGWAITALCQNWALPSVWIERSFAAIELNPDPYNMEGYFTIAGVWFGFVAGYAWWLEKKGKIILQGTAGKRILRYLVGMIGIVALYVGLKLLLPTSPEWLGFLFRFIRYALIGLWVSAIAPWIFEKIKLNA